MKQTATEWLFAQLWEEPKDKFTWQTILKKAKKLERKQIIYAHAADRYLKSVALEEGIDYYKETYENQTNS